MFYESGLRSEEALLATSMGKVNARKPRSEKVVLYVGFVRPNVAIDVDGGKP